jgi:hypothetical protein
MTQNPYRELQALNRVSVLLSPSSSSNHRDALLVIYSTIEKMILSIFP